MPRTRVAFLHRRGDDCADAKLCWLQKGITKLKNILEGEEDEQFTAEHYMMLYT